MILFLEHQPLIELRGKGEQIVPFHTSGDTLSQFSQLFFNNIKVRPNKSVKKAVHWASPSLNWREMWQPASSVNILMHRLKTVSYVEHDKCKHNIFWKIYLLLLVNMVGKLWFYSSNIDWRARHVWRWILPFMSDLNFLIGFWEKREKIVQFTAAWDYKYWVSIYSAILGHDFYFYIEAILSFITNYNKRWQKEKGKENCTISYIWGNAECQFTQPFCHIISIFTLEQYNNS